MASSRPGFVVRLLLPVLYVPLGIVAPVFGMNTDYGWSVVIGFWLPILLLSLMVLPREEPAMRWAFLIACLALVPVTVAFEYVGLSLDIWNFSEQHSRLWGPKLMGAPIEEFVFWFGATPLCLLLYLYYRRLFQGGWR